MTSLRLFNCLGRPFLQFGLGKAQQQAHVGCAGEMRFEFAHLDARLQTSSSSSTRPRPWSPGGYGERRRRPRGEVVTILTPGSTVRAICSGYVPEVYLGPWNTGRTTWDGSLAVR